MGATSSAACGLLEADLELGLKAVKQQRKRQVLMM